MQKLILLLPILFLTTTSAENLRSPLDLTCSVWSLQPSEIQNPKAVDWWATQSEMTGVQLDINEHGVHLLGAMIDKTWESYSGEVTDWYIRIRFEQRAESENFINLNTLTGSGFFYIGYKPSAVENDPDYKVKCVEVEEEIIPAVAPAVTQ